MLYIVKTKTISIRELFHSGKKVALWLREGRNFNLTYRSEVIGELRPKKKKTVKKEKLVYDYKKRREEIFGKKKAPDSQPILDYLREERF